MEQEKKAMKNLKISKKIICTFAVVLLLTFVLGVVSLVSTNNIASTSDNYVNISIPALSNLESARRYIRIFQGNILKATCTDDQADLDKLVEDISTDRSAFFAYLDSFLEYDPQFSDEVENIHTIMDDAASIREGIVEASAKFTYEGNQEAYSIYLNEYEPNLTKVTGILENLTTELEEAITTRYNNAQTTKTINIVIIIAVVVAAAILAYKDKSGKPHTKWVSTGLDAHNNRRRAAAMIPDMLQKYRGLEQLEVNSGTLFSDYAREWLEKKRPSLEKSTFDRYSNQVEKQLIPYFGKKPLCEITPRDVSVFYSQKAVGG